MNTQSSFSRPTLPPARRRALLRSCATPAIVALLMAAGSSAPARADSGNACVAQSNSPCVINTSGGNGPAGPNQGDSGGNGGAGGAAAHGFVTPQSYAPTGPTALATIHIVAAGGNGGDGQHDIALEATGGSGGNGGNGGAVTVSAVPGVDVATANPPLGSPTAPAGVVVFSGGGNGGLGAVGGHEGANGTGGTGGNGGAVSVTPFDGSITSTVAGQAGLLAASYGGNGGNGGSYFSDGLSDSNDDGANAGAAGSAGNVALEFGGKIAAQGTGILAVSAGGNGGTGGDPWTGHFPVGASGGDGGNGGAAGTVAVTIDSTGTVTTGTQDLAPAIWARSLGGQGGAGGEGGGDASGGPAGSGANAGAVAVTNNGTLGTGGGNSPGILAQSFGGAGANGGTGGGWGAGGGDGGTGGAGGAVSVGGSGSITTTGTNSPGVLAQSVGGGGGNGGNSSGWLAVGGAGAAAANGGTVTIEAAGTITTDGERSPGVLAQSVGGGGGNGGNASGSGLGLNLVIGGVGGGGGNAAEVDATSSAVIQTSGLHASGIMLQSVGGGGGNGGAAYGSETSLIAGANVSLGGTGGNGGSGAPIGLPSGATATNTGVITTSGANSFGILGQSIGGGGGVGGSSASTAKTYAVDTDPPLPTISIAVSLGGSGGSGGWGRPVTLGNAGLIATSGQGSAGLVAQSIGGGGGAGGDSSANAVAQGGDSPITISTSVSLGGKGGGGGSGQNVNAFNSGMIVTTGESSDGMLADSIGGGGGIGGTGDGQAKASGGGTSITMTLNLGGSGGGGGGGGPVSLTNTGAILTLGDGAAGMVAEGIGGGGGRGGGGAGSAGGGGSFSATVTLGGNGGNGGTTAPVSAINNGSIVTFGADAAGIIAQSIGGGGGDGGKAASSIGTAKSTSDGGNGGAATVDPRLAALEAAFLATGGSKQTALYNSTLGLAGLANDLLGNPTTAGLSAGDDTGTLDNLGESAGGNEDGNESYSITARVTVGGSGGAGASAGPVTVSTGLGSSIGTVAAMSDGIIAQSIGGGGGKGGAASTATSSGDGQVAIAVGGSGGSGGDGGTVAVGNQGSVTTIGGDAVGILAQSIGGGGGEGGASGSKTGALESVAISIGGSGATNGAAGAVSVTNSATIETLSHDAIGILAQSIGGGGGVVKTLSTDAEDNNGGGAVTTGGTYAIGLTFGGGTAGTTNSGNAGPVSVANALGTILTKGANAFGILAQSIGGGGGATLGGQIATNTNFFGAATLVGSADQTTGVQVEQAGTIATQGAGASAILAQSIGGGGGLAGNIGWTTQLVPFEPGGNHVGNGGPITISVQPDTVTETAGANAPAIFAQSIGGGGGRVATLEGAVNGSAGGVGSGGTVSIDIFGGALVSATGQSSAGIYAESAGLGGASAPITIQLGDRATVSGGSAIYSDGSDAPGIEVDSGSINPSAPNIVDNSGTITSVGGTGGMAILNRVGYLSVTNETTGVIVGNINLTAAGGTGTIDNMGTITAGQTIALGSGTLTNAGTLDVRNGQGGTTLAGNYAGSGTGQVVVGVNFATGSADKLAVTGNASLNAAAIRVDATSWQKSAPVTVLTVGGSLGGATALAASPMLGGYALGLATTVAGNAVQVQPVSNLGTVAASLSATARQVANGLGEVWDSGSALGGGFSALSAIGSAGALNSALTSIAGSAVRGVAATKQAASDRFFDNMVDCESFQPGATLFQEDNCGWARVIGSQTSLAGNDGDPGYHQTATTYQLGGQYEFSPGWFAGASLGFEQSWLNGDGASVTGQSGLAGLMIKRQAGPWLLTGEIDGGYGGYQSSRTIDVGSQTGSATASPSVVNLGAHVRAAYQMALAGGTYLEPSLTLGALYTNMPQYNEAGSTSFNLNVHGSDNVTASASPMVEFGGLRSIDDSHAVRAFVAVGAAAYSNSDWQGRANLELAPAGTGTFTVDSKLPSVVGKVNAGADVYAGHGLDVKLVYSADVASGFLSQAVIARLAYAF